jgi:molybdopterin-guanine dinucleotide biosynthesis protein A
MPRASAIKRYRAFRLGRLIVVMDAAIARGGPLPGAYRTSALPVLERRLAEGRLALRGALDELDTRVLELDPAQFANVNTPADLRALTR